MSARFPAYYESFDYPKLVEDYPFDTSFASSYVNRSRDEIRARQENDWQRCLLRAWQVPFYQRLWGDAGVEPGDIGGLEDIHKLPSFSKTELMESLAEHPPFGDYHGWDEENPDERPPVVFHTTSGTTGSPQALFFSPKTREAQALLVARAYYLQGLKSDDVVHSVYGFGMINGGHYVREAVLHYTNALFMSAGTGVETRSRAQVELMRRFGATVVVGFVDYIKRLADVAREMGLEPGRDLPVRMISGHLGRESRQAISDSWGGAEAFDWYGVGDTGLIATEGPDQDGMYVMEDAHYLEICDFESDQPITDDENGNMIVTCLYKDDIYPIIRFNTKDVSAWYGGESALGLPFKRIQGFLGRSDNMVKLRGINIYPQALGPILEAQPAFLGEYICRALREPSGRDRLIVMLEVAADRTSDKSLLREFSELLKQRLGIAVEVELHEPGSLAPLTGIETRQKPVRLLDERFN